MVEPRVGLFKERLPVCNIQNNHLKQIHSHAYFVQNDHINQPHIKHFKIIDSRLQVLSEPVL